MAPGRHLPEADLVAGWRGSEELRDGLHAFAGKLRAVGWLQTDGGPACGSQR